MAQFFELTINRFKDSTSEKKKNFTYVVEADTYTEAEASAYSIMEIEGFSSNFDIVKIVKLDIDNVFIRDLDQDDERTFFCQVKYVNTGIDERSGEEIVIDKFNQLILANDFPSVVRFVEEGSSSDLKIISQKHTNIFRMYFRSELPQVVRNEPQDEL